MSEVCDKAFEKWITTISDKADRVTAECSWNAALQWEQKRRQTMSEEKPLPCPFCGGEVLIENLGEDVDGEHAIGCAECGVCFPPDDDTDHLLDAWNKRAQLIGGFLFRRLKEGEIIQKWDEFEYVDGKWRPALCVGQKAPDPSYTSHRQYRRRIPIPDIEELKEQLQFWKDRYEGLSDLYAKDMRWALSMKPLQPPGFDGREQPPTQQCGCCCQTPCKCPGEGI